MTKAPRVEVRPLTDALPDPHNANKHTQRGAGMLERSMRKRGFFRPIAAAGKGVDSPIIMAGNLTQETAINAGMGGEAIFIYTDGTRPIVHVREDLAPDSKEAAQLSVEDNRIAEVSLTWDIDELGALDGDVLQDLWTPIELAIMGGAVAEGVDYQDAWKGMPEFDQDDKQGIILRVHFATENDRKTFFEKIGVDFTDKTNSIWYPERPQELRNQLGTGLKYTNEP